MRTFGYLVAAWILFGFLVNGLFVSGGGLALTALAAVGMVWLVRSYRRGPTSAVVDPRLARLAAAFPEDPLESDAIVQAWGPHVHDADALARLRAAYERTRRRLIVDGAADEAEDYLRAARVLAGEAPDLVERAVGEHGKAQRALEAAEGRTAAPILLAADERLQGAREALAKDRERPLDALRLASEAEQLAMLPRELSAARVEVEQTKDALAAAAARHADSALAEVRGLPDLAREEVDRARALAASEEPDEAIAALLRAREHGDRVTEHLARLERAAATARDRLHGAEAAVDEADGPDAYRAAALVAEARRELESPRPDWLEVAALAERALRLAGGTVVAQHVDVARKRARDARDEALAWALTGTPRGSEILPLAQAADAALRDAERIADEGLAVLAFERAQTLAEAAIAKLAADGRPAR